jgi:hypothetical protein
LETPLKFLLPPPTASSPPPTASTSQTKTITWTTFDDATYTKTANNKIAVIANKVGDFVYLSGTSRQPEKASEQQLLELFIMVKGMTHF